VLGGLVLAAVLSTRWVRLNVSGSLPYGLYRLAPVPPSLSRGTVVLLPVPETVQHVWSRWVPLLKPVAAVAGDTVCHTEGLLWVNGQVYGPLVRQVSGRLLPHITEGCAPVREGMVFLASPVPRSLDGRYFGLTPITSLTAQAIPVLTWQ
jgi:type IV secretory pathway protease TraF